ncbi:MAG: hypothetical protein ACREH8_17760 [Opitutaceae bacterium]
MSAPSAPARCPFHDGAATLDLLLAELDPRDTALFDAALDLRALCVCRADAAACIEQLFRVRALLDERHYLAFYRVRCWAQRSLRIEVRAGRASPWIARELPLDGARLDEIINASLASLAISDGAIPESAHVRFVHEPAPAA